MFSYRFALLFTFAAILTATHSTLPSAALAGGNVLAFAGPDISGDNTILVIEGDNEANEVRVTEVIPGHAFIEGLNGTTINGKASDEVESEGLGFHASDVALGNGDDRLIYDSALTTGGGGTRRIETGKGDDTVFLTLEAQFGVFNLETGAGNDHIRVDLAPELFADGDLRVNSGAGDDDVLVATGEPIFSSGFVTIETDKGDDVFEMQGVFFLLSFSQLFADLGGGNDILIGDSETQLPTSNVLATGGQGCDAVVNSSYFPSLFSLHSFEFIDEE